MTKSLELQVEQRLLDGRSKKKTYEELINNKNQTKLLYHLNNKVLLKNRKKHQYINLFLAGTLIFVTAKIFLNIFSYNRFGLFLVPELVVPTINLYLLKEILRFHKIGYQLLAALATLSLFHSQNRDFPELYLHIVMIGLSLFLFLNMFPKTKILRKKTR